MIIDSQSLDQSNSAANNSQDVTSNHDDKSQSTNSRSSFAENFTNLKTLGQQNSTNADDEAQNSSTRDVNDGNNDDVSSTMTSPQASTSAGPTKFGRLYKECYINVEYCDFVRTMSLVRPQKL